MDQSDYAATALLVVLLAVLLAAVFITVHPDIRTATGDSMETTIVSPAVIHCPAGTGGDVTVDDIAAVNHGDRTTIHRVTAIQDESVLTRGDGNDRHDGWASIDDVECVVTNWWSLNPRAHY